MRVPLACGALALSLGALSAIASLAAVGWAPTALVRVDSQTPLGAVAERVEPGFHAIHPGGYDGQWYWGIAVDPLGTGRAHAAFDHPAYRYSHPLYGWLGWLLSGGQARSAADVLLVVGLLSLGGATVAAAALGGLPAGLFVALNPGLLYAASHDLTEPLSALLLAGSLLAYARGARRLAIAVLALLVLSKEPFLFVPPALALWELARRRGRLRDAAALLLALVPAGAWWIWVRVHLGAWFTAGPSHALVWPGQGWYDALTAAARHTYDLDPTQNQFGEATVVVLVALAGLLLVAAVPALRLRSPAAAAYLPLLVLLACLGPSGTLYERDLLRAASIPLLLVPLVLRGSGSGAASAAPAGHRPP